MKKDIQGRADVELLVNSFYGRIKNDSLLSPIFRDIAKVDWDNHLPRMYNFWDSIIFQTGEYQGNPMALHQKLHTVAPLTSEHFNRWNEVFINTTRELFAGNNAEVAISRTMSISGIMKHKIVDHGGINMKK